ncbi:hypothetical protein KAYACHO_54 [Mycobacterium phage KayaCho]|uniref:hypothetical protein n=1 Tax=Mycobacterium phage KayaCho TaxID=1340830 RepID=UPI0003881078|nr:hypothetical protein N846_gp54 [Mycobacterium phage KayaCho]AGT12958.1 hypothetical protein KAYACHO_54 [Mycobacterium phage KayaCho]
MTDQPTDLDQVPDRRAITFLRSTTTTTTDIESDGDTDTEVVHVARFAVEPGAVEDMTRRYGTWIFRPNWLQVTWRDGALAEVRVTGPRVLKAGLSSTQGGDNEWRRPYRRFGEEVTPDFVRSELPAPIADMIALYEKRVVVASSSPTAPFL